MIIIVFGDYKYKMFEIITFITFSKFCLQVLLSLHVLAHRLLKDLVRLFKTQLEHLHELVELLPGVLGHQVYSQPCLAHLDNRELDSVDMHS